MIRLLNRASEREMEESTENQELILYEIVRDFGSPKIELIRLLKEASEIEHSLMLQYLFACFSIKNKYGTLKGFAFPGSKSLMGIAVQEMQHLQYVCLFLQKLGIAPSLDRQDFPYEPDIYPFEFNLEPLTIDTVAKYVYTEASFKDIDPSNGQDMPFKLKLKNVLGQSFNINLLSGLYDRIIELATEVKAQDSALKIEQSINHMIFVRDQGEDEHFTFFKSVFLGSHPAFDGIDNVWDLPEDHKDYPSNLLKKNPSAFIGHVNSIEGFVDRSIAWLSNIHYWTILLLLEQSYRYASNSSLYMDIAKKHMVSPLNILGNKLSEIGIGVPFDRLSIGYNPGIDERENNNFIVEIMKEGKRVVNDVKDHLPLTFDTFLYDNTITQIKNIK
ncbi:ferritin-like domain-containing protein [Fulvivirgaceae bacterium BMA12]|uniref:Ferritin-like domain-containing protein n=1 Tax=Agaribacillus aureus TaxID=3051825 RepID=A0ABT8LA58_9BACT|nr:ferritin-like domain-containing protein [Fulvivirgaceae bacterium BMA12]